MEPEAEPYIPADVEPYIPISVPPESIFRTVDSPIYDPETEQLVDPFIHEPLPESPLRGQTLFLMISF